GRAEVSVQHFVDFQNQEQLTKIKGLCPSFESFDFKASDVMEEDLMGMEPGLVFFEVKLLELLLFFTCLLITNAGVNLEQTLAIANRFSTTVSVQLSKDKKDFIINMDSSIATNHGDKDSTMAGFDIQLIGKQLAYIVRGETKFKNWKKNKTSAGMSVTFLGENVVTGFKVEDQITLGRQYLIIGSAGTVRFQTDSAYGANIEIQRRELDYQIGQVQSTLGLSIIK
ncbi:translocase of chloroplast 159, chloroplastic, partial [Tanacetum coccineum]